LRTVIISTLVQRADARSSEGGCCGNLKVLWPKIMHVSIFARLNYDLTGWELECKPFILIDHLLRQLGPLLRVSDVAQTI
jgi:hypothetical protein